MIYRSPIRTAFRHATADEGFRSAPCPSIFLLVTVRALAGSLSLVRRADAGHVAHCSGYAGISLLLFELKQRKQTKR